LVGLLTFLGSLLRNMKSYLMCSRRERGRAFFIFASALQSSDAKEGPLPRAAEENASMLRAHFLNVRTWRLHDH
jgi:hypothetical protein